MGKKQVRNRISLKYLILIAFIIHYSFAAWASDLCTSDSSSCACAHHGCEHEDSGATIGHVCNCDLKVQISHRNEVRFPVNDSNPLFILPFSIFLPTDNIISQVSEVTEYFHVHSDYANVFSRAPPFSLV